MSKDQTNTGSEDTPDESKSSNMTFTAKMMLDRIKEVAPWVHKKVIEVTPPIPQTARELIDNIHKDSVKLYEMFLDGISESYKGMSGYWEEADDESGNMVLFTYEAYDKEFPYETNGPALEEE